MENNCEYTDKLIKTLANKLDIDIKDINIEELRMGMADELEHGSEAGEKLNVTNDDPIETFKIAVAHLKSDKNYYSKLKKANIDESSKRFKELLGFGEKNSLNSEYFDESIRFNEIKFKTEPIKRLSEDDNLYKI